MSITGTTVTLTRSLAVKDARRLGEDEAVDVLYPAGTTLFVDGTGVDLLADHYEVDVFVYDEDERGSVVKGSALYRAVSDEDARAALGAHHYRALTGRS